MKTSRPVEEPLLPASLSGRPPRPTHSSTAIVHSPSNDFGHVSSSRPSAKHRQHMQLVSELNEADDIIGRQNDPHVSLFAPQNCRQSSQLNYSRQLSEPTEHTEASNSRLLLGTAGQDESNTARKLRRLAEKMTVKGNEQTSGELLRRPGKKPSLRAIPCCKCCAQAEPRFRGVSSRNVFNSSLHIRDPPLTERKRRQESMTILETTETSVLQRYWDARDALLRKYQVLISKLQDEELCEMRHYTTKILSKGAEGALELQRVLEEVRIYYEDTRQLISRQSLGEQEELVGRFREKIERGLADDEDGDDDDEL